MLRILYCAPIIFLMSIETDKVPIKENTNTRVNKMKKKQKKPHCKNLPSQIATL